MIKKQTFLQVQTLNPQVVDAVNELHWGLGKNYDLQVMIGHIDKSFWSAYVAQGRDLKECNQARKAVGLFPLGNNDAPLIVKEEWGTALMAGNAVVVAIQKGDYRFKLNRDIENVMEWLKQRNEKVSLDYIENPKFDFFIVSMSELGENAGIPDNFPPDDEFNPVVPDAPDVTDVP